MNTPNPIDLEFASLAERDRQYNARASVADFDACMRDYVQSSALARQQCVGMYDLRYGMGWPSGLTCICLRVRTTRHRC